MLFRPSGLLGRAGHQEGMSAAPRRPIRAPVGPRDRAGRVGRASRRAARAARRPLRPASSSACARAPGGPGCCSSSAAFALLPVVSDDGYLRRVALRHRALHAARARAQRRRRLGRACSTSATSPSTASAPTPTRCSRSRPVRRAPADARRDPARGDDRRSSSGFLVGLPSRRLVGDYLAIVTLFFRQIFLTLATNGNQTLRPTTSRTAPTASCNVDPLDLFGHALAGRARGRLRRRLPLRRARRLRRRLRRAPLRQPLAHRAAPGARCARTRSQPRRWACPSTG